MIDQERLCAVHPVFSGPCDQRKALSQAAVCMEIQSAPGGVRPLRVKDFEVIPEQSARAVTCLSLAKGGGRKSRSHGTLVFLAAVRPEETIVLAHRADNPPRESL